MSFVHIIPFGSTLVAWAFAAAVLVRYTRRRGLHLLLWGVGLILYGLGTFGEAFLAIAFSALVLRLWYLTGALLTPAWLGQGTVYLLVRRKRIAHTLMGLLALATVIAVAKVLSAPLTSVPYNVSLPVSVQYKDILTRDGLTIGLLILLATYGTITLVGGAIYSAYLFWRKRVLPNRVVGNILIAAGALLPATAGAQVANRLGGDWLFVSEFLGAIVMFIGFLQATARRPESVPASQAEIARTT